MYEKISGVQQGFKTMLCMFVHEGGERIVENESRYGNVKQLLGPCTITYTDPQMRVLQSPRRNCNPFFHLYEALWMLTGRKDVASLKQFNRRIESFSDDRETFHAAYGHRWRSHFGGDQLRAIIKELKADPKTRRCYLNMWDPQEDLYGFIYDHDYEPNLPGILPATEGDSVIRVPYSKDYPCNVGCLFQAYTSEHLSEIFGNDTILNLTVFNRSNDLFWGMLGSNYVTFSILLEYVAQMCGMAVGHYTHITANCHYYTDIWSDEDVKAMHDEVETCLTKSHQCIPLVTDPNTFDDDLEDFVSEPFASRHFATHQRFLNEIAAPMMQAWQAYKQHEVKLAIGYASDIQQADWRTACIDWFIRILDNRRVKSYQHN